jgi:hypothetical protein
LSPSANSSLPTSLGAIENWINVDVIQKLAHHTSTVIAALVVFWLVGFMVRRLMEDGIFKHAVLWIDEFVLLILFVYFAYELFIYL